MNLMNLVRVYPNAFDSVECKRMIDMFHDMQSEQYHTSVMKFDQITLPFDWEMTGVAVDRFMEFFDTYRKQIKKLGQTRLPQTDVLENLRIKRYPEDGYFKEHIDAADRPSSTRFLSGFVYLNDSGGTRFFDRKIVASEGKLVIFPPQWMYPHTGLVGKKPKYFLSTYMHFSA